MTSFNEISSNYKKNSRVQKSAALKLFDLLEIDPFDDILDLGCGPGHLASLMKQKTSGQVTGIDPSLGMIKEAQKEYSQEGLIFYVSSAEDMNDHNKYDKIFCNSAFQWFKNPDEVIRNCYRALKYNGKIAVQAPAKTNYCPQFIQAVQDVSNHEKTQEIFRSFQSPWFFLETKEEYSNLFERHQFKVEFVKIEPMIQKYTVQETFKIFESGAAAGYLNQKFYNAQLTEEYISSFKDVILQSFKNQSDENGVVNLTFHRFFLVASQK